LLFPAPWARDLADVPQHDHPAHLVVLDGTWSHARRLYRHNPWLHVLPQFSITPDAPSRYRLRRQPKTHFLSTIESIVQALRILEPETRGFGQLIRAFDEMIATQARYDPRRARSRHGSATLDCPRTGLRS
jgi:DTW domain-containing protein YfiP